KSGKSAVRIKSGIERIAGADSWRLAGEGSGRGDFGVGLAMESLQPALRAERSVEAAGSYHGWLAGGRAGRRRGLNLNASRAAGFAFRRDTASISEEIESVSNQFGALRILAAATTLKQLNAVFGVDGSPMPVGETNA